MKLSHLLILFGLVAVSCPIESRAADSYKVTTSAYVTINEHGVCKRVKSVESTRMVPTKFASEWTSFRNNDVGMMLLTCTCNLPWGGTINDGNSVNAWTNDNPDGGCTKFGPCGLDFRQTRTCNGDKLSGTAQYQSCFYQNSGCS